MGGGDGIELGSKWLGRMSLVKRTGIERRCVVGLAKVRAPGRRQGLAGHIGFEGAVSVLLRVAYPASGVFPPVLAGEHAVLFCGPLPGAQAPVPSLGPKKILHIRSRVVDQQQVDSLKQLYPCCHHPFSSNDSPVRIDRRVGATPEL